MAVGVPHSQQQHCAQIEWASLPAACGKRWGRLRQKSIVATAVELDERIGEDGSIDNGGSRVKVEAESRQGSESTDAIMDD